MSKDKIAIIGGGNMMGIAAHISHLQSTGELDKSVVIMDADVLKGVSIKDINAFAETFKPEPILIHNRPELTAPIKPVSIKELEIKNYITGKRLPKRKKK